MLIPDTWLTPELVQDLVWAKARNRTKDNYFKRSVPRPAPMWKPEHNAEQAARGPRRRRS